MSERDLEYPPWKDNFDDWEYRIVKVKGRLIYGKGNLQLSLIIT
jgi:hypothetical protein